MKRILLGIIIGIIISSSVAFGTDIIRNSYFNSDLKLAINNHQVSDIRIVTVELEGEKYGRNYYSIADLVKALNDYGGISAKVDFDSETKTTIIDIQQNIPRSPNITITPTPPPTPTQKRSYLENPRKISGDFINIPAEVLIDEKGEETFMYSGIKYITENSMIKLISNTDEDFHFAPIAYDTGFIYISPGIEGFEIQIIHYQDTRGYWNYCADYDYFKNIVIPFIEQYEK